MTTSRDDIEDSDPSTIKMMVPLPKPAWGGETRDRLSALSDHSTGPEACSIASLSESKAGTVQNPPSGAGQGLTGVPPTRQGDIRTGGRADQVKWSEAARDILRDLWPRELPVEHVLSQLKKLNDGQPYTINAVYGQASDLGLRRCVPVKRSLVAASNLPLRFRLPVMDGGVTLLELNASSCRNVIGEGDNGQPFYCARPFERQSARMRPYCPECRAALSEGVATPERVIVPHGAARAFRFDSRRVTA